MPTNPLPARSISRNGSAPRARSNGRSTGPLARRLHPVLLQHRAHARGRHPCGRLLGRDPQGHQGLWRAGQQPQSHQITRDDLTTGGCALVSCFIREPEFVGQTKDRLATTEAQRLVENSVRDHFDNWLAADTKSAGAILDFLSCGPRNACAAVQEKETARKSATKKLRLPGKLTDCSSKDRDGTELFIVEGDSAGGSGKGAATAKTQALLPLKGKILNVLGAASSKLGSNAEKSDLCEALGCGMGTRFNIDDLRYEKIIIMTDADVDGAHIASLLMTFFFTQMRPLIDARATSTSPARRSTA